MLYLFTRQQQWQHRWQTENRARTNRTEMATNVGCFPVWLFGCLAVCLFGRFTGWSL